MVSNRSIIEAYFFIKKDEFIKVGEVFVQQHTSLKSLHTGVCHLILLWT